MDKPAPEMQRSIIELKCWPISFQAIKNGTKHFEYRKNDRPYEVGITIRQREWNPETEYYTGEELYHDITFIIRGGVFGIPEGYCIFSTTEPRKHPVPPKDAVSEHYNGVCAFNKDKCNDYSDFIESIKDELNPDDEDPVCPIRCDFRSNPYPHTTSPDTQRIAGVIEKLEVMRERNERRGDHETKPNFHDGIAYGCEHAIALLRESNP